MNGSLGEVSVRSFEEALTTLANAVFGFIPQLVVALFSFIVLWIVAVMLGRLVEQVVRALKIDSVFESLGAEEVLTRGGFKLDSGAFLGGLVRWFFIVLALLVAVNILGLTEVSIFLASVVAYIPNVVIAAIFIIAAAVLGDIVQRIARGSAHAAHMPAAALIGAVAKWAIWIFALLAALLQLRIVPELVQTLVTALVAMVALAGGLAFGLGGKEHASQLIEKLRRDIRE
ncbi:MAG: hypothetical protein A3F26_01645 [Candidatus Ryanbacteria bacterium RIFCSPHIGHO2_12_FULL_47_12b]|uniref:Small-conductance mechanosensitive ion channel n=1 Tax=Candidatus Ryanbacteria bacterium RIFCSPLOWO2_02_FULL_47_14 TaxID=1802129 RepID=A0A1G2GYP8_9BACT|nr:MAG: hypothetical protein A3F26_01645 [Candidatus Ryanbacteria bacterium RIFCSPHIGHO2_12_FULL_47_12b]OGZ55346.1 MAG: hypothetical protein A3J04_03735 [Candidatus Ryanbacteria bacterium RIFCSPLOWO2_02_FULL_47_14]